MKRRRPTARDLRASHLTSEPIATLPVRRTLRMCVHCRGYGWVSHPDAGRGLPPGTRMECVKCKGEGEVAE